MSAALCSLAGKITFTQFASALQKTRLLWSEAPHHYLLPQPEFQAKAHADGHRSSARSVAKRVVMKAASYHVLEGKGPKSAMADCQPDR